MRRTRARSFRLWPAIRHLHIELLGALFADKIDLLFACFAYCYGIAAAQQLQKHDIFEDQVDVPQVAAEHRLADAVVGNVILLICGKDLLALQVLPLDLIEQIGVAAVFEIVQDRLRRDIPLLVLQKTGERGRGERRADIRHDVGKNALKQVDIADHIALDDILERTELNTSVRYWRDGSSAYRRLAR